jgi:hypothetical protein
MGYIVWLNDQNPLSQMLSFLLKKTVSKNQVFFLLFRSKEVVSICRICSVMRAGTGRRRFARAPLDYRIRLSDCGQAGGQVRPSSRETITGRLLPLSNLWVFQAGDSLLGLGLGRRRRRLRGSTLRRVRKQRLRMVRGL